jgi:hypothetical protein
MLLCLTRPAVGEGGSWLLTSEDVHANAAASSAAATAATLRGGLLLLLCAVLELVLSLLLGCAATLLGAA